MNDHQERKNVDDLSHVGLTVREVSAPKGQTRFEVRTPGLDGKHVACFHHTVRMSDREPVVNVTANFTHRKEVTIEVETSTQLVRRSELTEEQVAAVEKWQEELVISALKRSP